jgi:hypothetical protein
MVLHVTQNGPTCKVQNYKMSRRQIGENLYYLECGDDFLNETPVAQSMKENING